MDMQAPHTSVDLGRTRELILHLAPDHKRLQLQIEAPPEGLDKTAVNGLIQALKEVRETMHR